MEINKYIYLQNEVGGPLAVVHQPGHPHGQGGIYSQVPPPEFEVQKVAPPPLLLVLLVPPEPLLLGGDLPHILQDKGAPLQGPYSLHPPPPHFGTIIGDGIPVPQVLKVIGQLGLHLPGLLILALPGLLGQGKQKGGWNGGHIDDSMLECHAFGWGREHNGQCSDDLMIMGQGPFKELNGLKIS